MNDKKLMIKSKGILNQIGLLGVIAVLCIIFTCLNSTFIAGSQFDEYCKAVRCYDHRGIWELPSL